MCDIEEASFYHSRHDGCFTRFSNEKKPLTRDYVKSGLIVLFILIMGATAFPLFQVMAPDLDSESSLEGELSFTVYPDGDFGMKIMGTFEDSYEEYQVISPIREMLMDFQIDAIETNLHKGSGSCVFKLSPQFALFLSSLELEIDVHTEYLSSEALIHLSLPGMIELNGMVETEFQDETYEGSIGVEFTAKIWYSILPKEVIQEFLMAFSDYKVEMESQLDFYSEGNLEFQELTIVESELDDLSATITARITVAGDFSEGIMAAAESFGTEFDSQVESIPYEELSFTEVRSSDLHIYYEREDLAFYLDYEVLIEGDIDEQVNSMKDHFLEELLEDPKLDPDEAEIIRDMLLPTNISVIDLETFFNSTMEEGSVSIDFGVDGLILKQPDPKNLLSLIEEISEEVTNEELTLTINGASEGDKYVEIGVPAETTMPLTEESDSVSWNLAELENLDEVTFDVKEKPSTLPSTLPSTGYLLPAVGAVVIVALAAGLYFMRRR